MSNVWEEAKLNLRKAAEVIDLEPHITERLSKPMRFTEFTIPLRMDDGRRMLFTAFRSLHQDATGPTKDGTRIRPGLTPEEVKALSLFMSIKHAVADIPAGGGKGGIAADPSKLSAWELERLVRGFIRRLIPRGAHADVPGADIGTDTKTMGWMLDEYEQITGLHSPAAVNDKPFELGGTLGGFEATGWGVARCAHLAFKDLKLKRKTVSIQGFGQVGSVTSLSLFETGYKIIAVSDLTGSIENKRGLDIDALIAHTKQTGAISGFTGGSAFTESVLEKDCDILIPAALQDVITAGNAGKIKAPLIVEAANAPITPDADLILDKNGRTVVPDVIANCGGAVACDFERTQGLSNDSWPLDLVRARLFERMENVWLAATEIKADLRICLRQAAWVKALRKIRDAMNCRGWS
jgi:glutamate dehydrogenase/leucine dehydrogenase